MKILSLTYHLNNREILKNISIELSMMGINWVLGSNGSGKSTLLKILAGLETKFQGQLPAMLQPNSHERLGFLYQYGTSYPHLTLLEHMSLFKIHFGLSSFELMNCLEQWGLQGYKNTPVHKLSSGQRSRFMLALVLVNQPQVLLLDEPENYLDYQGLQRYDQCLQSWSHSNVLVIIASHFPQRVRVDDTLIVLENGAVCFNGLARTLAQNPLTGASKYLLDLQHLVIDAQ